MSEPEVDEVIRMQEAARSWRHILEERADEVEKARRVPDDLARALASDGFYRMWVTRSLGGLEFPLVPTLDVLESLAEGDPAVAWCVAIGITSSLALTSIPKSSAEKIFANPETIMAGVFAPSGRADARDDGFDVSGRWSFGSGTQNADWILAGCRYFRGDDPIDDDRGRPRTHMVCVPRRDVEFVDNWDVLGLCGTGSCDFKLDGVYVPEDRVAGFFPSQRPAGSLYRIPNLTLLAVGFGAIALGLARAALVEFYELAATKRGMMSIDLLGKRSDVQNELARVEVALRAARSHYYEMAEAIQAAAEDGKVEIDHRADLRLANCHAVDTAVKITSALFRLGGGSSIYRGSRLQRFMRDANVITQHIQVCSQNYTVIGSQLLGHPHGVGIL